jgi:hypothetical protein
VSLSTTSSGMPAWCGLVPICQLTRCLHGVKVETAQGRTLSCNCALMIASLRSSTAHQEV